MLRVQSLELLIKYLPVTGRHEYIDESASERSVQ